MTASSATRLDYSAPRIDQVMEGLILALLLYLPLAFGGVMPVSRIVLIAMGSLIAACFAVRCAAEPDATITWSWTFVPVGLIVLLAAFQTLALPIGLVEILSPQAADVWKTAAAAAGSEVKTATLSVYPHGTKTDMALLASGAIILMVGATIYRRRGAFRRLLTGIALIGLIVALIGLTQTTLGAEQIYWMFDGPGTNSSGPFASYSHYSEFINIAIGCALGALLIRAANRGPTREIQLHSIFDWDALSWVQKALCAFLLLGAVAIALSTSRNGLVSLVVALAVCAALMQVTRKVEGIGWPMVGFAFVAFAGLLAMGIDPVIERFERAADDPTTAVSTRLDLIRDTASMAMSYGAFGSGLGSYELAFPAFDTAVRGGTAEHAENQYMEVFAELGFIGSLLVLSFLVLSIRTLWRQLRSTASRTDYALFGVFFALTAIAFHSLTDFGMEIPAVALAITTVTGAALGRCSNTILHSSRARIASGLLAVSAATLLVTSLPLAFEANDGNRHALIADDLRRELQTTSGIGTKEQHARLIEHTSAAALADPTNAKHRFWAILAEWNAAIAEVRGHDPKGPSINPLTHPELATPATKAVSSLVANLKQGPTHGPTWSVAGQLKSLWMVDPEDDAANNPEVRLAGDWILRGRHLAPHNPSTCMAAAFELMRRSDEPAAMAELKRAVSIGANKYGVVNLLAGDLQRPTLALPFVEGDLGLTERLLTLTKKTLDKKTDPTADLEVNATLVESLKSDYETLLAVACARPSARPHELGKLASIEQKRGNTDQSVSLYRRLLSVDPYSTQRYKYAQLLVEEDQLRDARRELRDVLQFHPGHKGATKLLQKLESQIDQ